MKIKEEMKELLRSVQEQEDKLLQKIEDKYLERKEKVENNKKDL